MAGILTVNTLSDGTNSGSVQSMVKGSARAWVDFNGSGTVSIRNQYNVSSISDLGTGYYQINFSTAMPNSSYAPCGFVWRAGTAEPNFTGSYNHTTSSLQIRTGQGGFSHLDSNPASVIIFGS